MAQEILLEKIRKLLKLSEGAAAVGSVHEAATAAATAQRLLFEHKLSMSDVPIGDAPREEPVGQHHVPFQERGKRVTRWRMQLLCAIARQNFCRVAYYSPGANTCNILGRSDSVQTVTYLFSYLVIEIDRLALNDLKARQLNKGDAKTWANNFRLGAVEAIENKMHEMNNARRAAAVVDQAAGSGKALMVIDREKMAIDTYYEQHIKGNTRRGSAWRSNYSSSARDAGRRAGAGINLNSQISGRSPKRIGGK